MSATIFVEGGGQGKALKSAIRKGFRSFFEDASPSGTIFHGEEMVHRDHLALL